MLRTECVPAEYAFIPSTISPIASKEFYATAKSKGMTWIDSPMSGGIMGAQNATLTFMVGALESDPDYAHASLVL